MSSTARCAVVAFALITGCARPGPAPEPAGEALFTARDFTAPGTFTDGVEGPAVDRGGNVYAVNAVRQGTIGRVTPAGEVAVFVDLPAGSIGNGLRFGPDGDLFVADYTGHNILRIDRSTGAVRVHAHEPAMHQPNDLAIAPDGRLYASDPNWAGATGNLWRIDPDGTVTRLAAGLGTTNGIEVSPDGRTLYVNESVQRTVWAYPLRADGTLGDRRLLLRFPDFGLDGMRADVDGNLYITRHGKGTVVKVSPAGAILEEIRLQGANPTNLAFGGPDGRTVYVTVADRGNLETFRADRPGRSTVR